MRERVRASTGANFTDSLCWYLDYLFAKVSHERNRAEAFREGRNPDLNPETLIPIGFKMPDAPEFLRKSLGGGVNKT